MKHYNIAVLGATGAVGQEMLRALDERGFPLGQLFCLASKGGGRTLEFKGQPLAVLAADDFDFSRVDMVLGAADNDTARRLAERIVAAGAVFIDNSSAFRMEAHVPLVVPEINPQDALGHRGIIANPNCSTIIALTAAWPIVRRYGVTAMVAATYQAVSGAGVDGQRQLESEVAGRPAQHGVFEHPIAFNVLPLIGGVGPDGYSSEEVKLQNEGRKILHRPELRVSCTCVRVPVMRCHSIALNLRTERPVSVPEARAAIEAGQGVALLDAPEQGIYPMPLNTGDQDTVYVGRIRPDPTAENGLCLWCCGDQLRKGAAVNAVQIAEVLI